MSRKRAEAEAALRELVGPDVDLGALLAVFLENLVDAQDVAPLIGLGGPDQVRAYASVRLDFPRPILPRDPDARPRSTRYWWRPDIVAWREHNQRRPGRPPASPPVTPPS